MSEADLHFAAPRAGWPSFDADGKRLPEDDEATDDAERGIHDRPGD